MIRNYNLTIKSLKWPMLFIAPMLLMGGEASATVVTAHSANIFQSVITGTVVSKSDGLGLPGATIMVKGTQQNTVTDMDGKFSLTVTDPNAVLVISFMGFKTQEIPVAGQSNMSITLEEDAAQLDEVVVIGYGTQRKGDVTSAVASVKAENFNLGQVKDAGQLIQGKVAGLAITNVSGDPTATTSIKLRGNNTIGGAYQNPLVLIDGIPGELNTVAPEDIESIDVLKDGSAAAIYGVRGTNGVILITTKKAKGGDMDDVQYSGYVSTSRIASKLDNAIKSGI